MSDLIVQLALVEDIGPGDITTLATISPERTGSAVILAKEPLVVCGQQVAAAVFAEVKHRFGYYVEYRAEAPDGSACKAGEQLAAMHGSLIGILIAERTVLNFLQHLSGIASYTKQVVKQLDGKAKLLDTRKTTPGYRALEKYAVATGGGTNHRHGLFDAVLIKNNHIDALQGDIAKAITQSRSFAPPGTKVEVEVRSLEELEAALAAKPDAILLDNMAPELLRRAVKLVRSSATGAGIELEASGGITMETVAAYGATGVDFISMGSLTHSARAVDISLRYAAD
ncbi:MAG: carboxylating nicotinate-nucleotide diphosphorylase, partial [Bdellovibrionales bacterium]|nr:carboxylating nicotinate-nucleotide diphosphorylase [Bdellovibrionales bacterium]